MSENARFMWDNTKFDGATLAASSQKSSLPALNLQSTLRQKPWKTDGTGQATLDIGFEKEVYCDALSLVSHDLGVEATVTVYAYSNETEQALSSDAADLGGGLVQVRCDAHGYSPGDEVFLLGTTGYNGIQTISSVATNTFSFSHAFTAESFTAATTARLTQSFSREFDAYESLIYFGEGVFGEGVFGGYLDEDALALLPKISRTVFWDDVGGDATYKKYWRLEFDNGATEFEMGRIFLCSFFEPSRPFRHGWKLMPVDPSTVTKSIGGVKWTDRKEQFYRVSFDLKRMSKSEAFGEFIRIVRAIGVHKDMLLCLFPGDDDLKYFTSIYGRFQAVPSLTGMRMEQFATKITFEESL